MIKNKPVAASLVKTIQALTAAVVVVGLTAPVVSAQFKLGAEEKNFIESAPAMNNNYATPTYSGGAAEYGRPALQGGAQQQPPLQAAATRTVALPPAFMGSWLVQGQRTGIEALPEFQNGIGNLFAGSTSNTWNISGSPQQGYQMSNDQGVSTALTIYKVSKNTAFIRYQHPIGKTMAQEAIVMELQNGGASFQGLERISIVKDGQQPPRAKVTYQLVGQRQR